MFRRKRLCWHVRPLSIPQAHRPYIQATAAASTQPHVTVRHVLSYNDKHTRDCVRLRWRCTEHAETKKASASGADPGGGATAAEENNAALAPSYHNEDTMDVTAYMRTVRIVRASFLSAWAHCAGA